MVALFTVWMDAISSDPMLLRAAREMVERTGILEASGNNLQRETGVADGSSVLLNQKLVFWQKGRLQF